MTTHYSWLAQKSDLCTAMLSAAALVLPVIFALLKDIGWRFGNLNEINNLVLQILSTGGARKLE